jgi:hypothetical protein
MSAMRTWPFTMLNICYSLERFFCLLFSWSGLQSGAWSKTESKE